jgi:hypothetical protein
LQQQNQVLLLTLASWVVKEKFLVESDISAEVTGAAFTMLTMSDLVAHLQANFSRWEKDVILGNAKIDSSASEVLRALPLFGTKLFSTCRGIS